MDFVNFPIAFSIQDADTIWQRTEEYGIREQNGNCPGFFGRFTRVSIEEERDEMTKLIATIAAVLITAPSSFAGIQEFEDEERPLWFDAVGAGNYVTIDFYEFPENTTLTNEYKPWGVTFSGLNFVSPSILDPDGSVLRIIDGNDIYFSEPINWVAADISGAITIELFVGDTKFFTSQSFGAGPTPHFGGLISEQAFDHIRIYDRFDNVANLHDFYFGPPIAVPAPGAIALTPLILLFRRRRR